MHLATKKCAIVYRDSIEEYGVFVILEDRNRIEKISITQNIGQIEIIRVRWVPIEYK